MASLIRPSYLTNLFSNRFSVASTSGVFSKDFHSSTSVSAGMMKKSNVRQSGVKRTRMGGKNKKKGKSIMRKTVPLTMVKLNHPLWSAEKKPYAPLFNPIDMTSHAEGTVRTFPTEKGTVIDTFGVPKLMEKEFRTVYGIGSPHPFSIIRKSTLELFDVLAKVASSDPGQSNRLVLTGDAGSGKSMTLLQSAYFCAMNNWIVFYEPRAITWVNSSSSYAFDYRSQLFHQNQLAASMLAKLISFNKDKLSKIKLEHEVPQPGGRGGVMIPAGTTIDALANIGIKEPLLAAQTLVLVMQELEKQTKFPVLLAIDDFQALYQTSAYKDPQFKSIPSYHLSTPRLILEYASGKRKLNKGVLLGAISQSNNNYPLTAPLRQGLDLGWEGVQEPTPFDRKGTSYASFAKGIKAVPTPNQFSLVEFATFLESWKNGANILHSPLNDSFLLAKYTETGGNPRQMLHKGILGTLQTL